MNKETIDIVKQLVEDGHITQEIAFMYVPELKESEDEKIRKELIEYIRKTTCVNFIGKCSKKEAEKFIDWLEKRGEQKSVIYIPKFNVGDRLVSTTNPSLTYKILEVGHINELGNPEYKVIIFADGEAKSPQNIHYMECQKVDEWAKLIEQKSAMDEQNHALRDEDIRRYNSILSSIKYCSEQYPCKKEYDKDINWLKDILQLQSKQEWNEEDERNASYICAALDCYYRLREDRNNTNGQEDLDKARNWLYNKLKFLRPQKQ